MALVATATQALSNLIKKSDTDNTELLNELVTVNEAGITAYKVGTLLGKVSANGKYKESVQNAADGSQNAVAIVIGNSFGDAVDFSVPATTDTKVLALAHGKVEVSKAALKWHSSYDLDAEKTAAYASLAGVGIFAESNFV